MKFLGLSLLAAVAAALPQGAPTVFRGPDALAAPAPAASAQAAPAPATPVAPGLPPVAVQAGGPAAFGPGAAPVAQFPADWAAYESAAKAAKADLAAAQEAFRKALGEYWAVRGGSGIQAYGDIYGPATFAPIASFQPFQATFGTAIPFPVGAGYYSTYGFAPIAGPGAPQVFRGPPSPGPAGPASLGGQLPYGGQVSIPSGPGAPQVFRDGPPSAQAGPPMPAGGAQLGVASGPGAPQVFRDGPPSAPAPAAAPMPEAQIGAQSGPGAPQVFRDGPPSAPAPAAAPMPAPPMPAASMPSAPMPAASASAASVPAPPAGPAPAAGVAAPDVDVTSSASVGPVGAPAAPPMPAMATGSGIEAIRGAPPTPAAEAPAAGRSDAPMPM